MRLRLSWLGTPYRLTPDWLKQCALNIPTTFDMAIPNQISINSETFAKFGKTSSDSANGNNSVPARVSGLFFARSPLAVFSKVAKVVVSAFNGETVRSFSHVLKKVFKLHPAVTDSYPATAIPLKTWVVSVVASRFYVRPYEPCFTPAFPVGQMVGSGQISPEASTGFCIPSFKIWVWKCNRLAAIARAHAASVTVFVFLRLRNHFKSSKPLSDEGLFFRHGIGRSMLCSVVGVRVQPALTAIMPVTTIEANTN